MLLLWIVLLSKVIRFVNIQHTDKFKPYNMLSIQIQNIHVITNTAHGGPLIFLYLSCLLSQLHMAYLNIVTEPYPVIDIIRIMFALHQRILEWKTGKTIYCKMLNETILLLIWYDVKRPIIISIDTKQFTLIHIMVV